VSSPARRGICLIAEKLWFTLSGESNPDGKTINVRAIKPRQR
jgi:hypothetical protein